MKGQKNFIFALIFALIVAIFAVINVDPVEVNYLFGSGQAPLVLVILGSVLMGGLIAGTFGMVRLYKLQREKRTLEQQLKQYELEQTHHSSTVDTSDEEQRSKESEPSKNS
ncbi:lipopolysaccharide assembly LapA domain-containing protein [Pontibacillus salicampi]|uniref:Lipopolysaccharide assembly LapA domain-containing protein n=1 Tax=Pontibacillus salicampi TaxID=1449801 RepID=A0ABV6LJC6_9BACI